MWNSWSLCIDASFSAAAWEHKYYKRRSRSCNVYLMYWLCIYWFFSLIDNLPRCQGFHHSLTHTKKNTYEIHSLSLLQVNTRKTKKKTKRIQEIENHYLVSRNERQIQRRIEKGGNRVIRGGGDWVLQKVNQRLRGCLTLWATWQSIDDWAPVEHYWTCNYSEHRIWIQLARRNSTEAVVIPII